MVGGVIRYAAQCPWLPLVGCKIRLPVALVLLPAGSSSSCAFGRSSPWMSVSHNEKTKLFLLVLVFIFLIGDHHCGKSGVATAIVVWRSTWGGSLAVKLCIPRYPLVRCIRRYTVLLDLLLCLAMRCTDVKQKLCWYEFSRGTVFFVVSESFNIIRRRKGKGVREWRGGALKIGHRHTESGSVLKIFHSRKWFQIFYSQW